MYYAISIFLLKVLFISFIRLLALKGPKIGFIYLLYKVVGPEKGRQKWQ